MSPAGLPWPPPGHLPNPGIEALSQASPALVSGFFSTSATWEDHTRASKWQNQDSYLACLTLRITA